MKIVKLEKEDLAANLDEIMHIYASVYSLPPYSESEEQIAKVRESWSLKFNKEGFLFLAALNDKHNMCGFTFGWRSVSGGNFHERVKTLLHNEAMGWLEDCYELVDIAVHPQFQGQGMGKALLENLFAHVTTRTALLQTHTEDTHASHMYKKRGWETLLEAFEISPGLHYRIMGKKLK